MSFAQALLTKSTAPGKTSSAAQPAVNSAATAAAGTMSQNDADIEITTAAARENGTIPKAAALEKVKSQELGIAAENCRRPPSRAQTGPGISVGGPSGSSHNQASWGPHGCPQECHQPQRERLGEANVA